MKKKELKGYQYLCKELLISKMTDYVREHGEDVTDYDRNEFGLDFEDGGKVKKVLNLFDNGGCYFALPNKENSDEEYNCDNVLDYQLKLENNFTFHAVQCLYIEEWIDGKEYLMSYSFWNGGVKFLDDLSEPEHESLINEPFAYVNAIANVLWKE